VGFEMAFFPPLREKTDDKTLNFYTPGLADSIFNTRAESSGAWKCELWKSSPRLLPRCGEFSVLCPAWGS